MKELEPQFTPVEGSLPESHSFWFQIYDGPLSRGEFIKVAILGGSSALLTACLGEAPKPPTPTPTLRPTATREVTKIPTPTPTKVPASIEMSTPIPTVESEINRSGGKIAFVRQGGQLWVMNPDGSERTLVAQAKFSFAFDPVWSPKGDKLAIPIKDDKGGTSFHWEIFDLNGKSLTKIEREADLSWFLPDGNSVIYSDKSGVYTLDLATKKTTTIVDSASDTVDPNPSLSPDGKKLAFVHLEQGLGGTIAFYPVVVGLDELKSIAKGLKFGFGLPGWPALVDGFAKGPLYHASFKLQWTPDSKTIVFSRGNNIVGQIVQLWGKGERIAGSSDESTIAYVVEVNSGKVSRIKKSLTDGSPEEWFGPVELSHKGDQMAYISANDGSIYLVSIDGTNMRKIGATMKREYSLFVRSPRWSPDDNWVAYFYGLDNIRLINTKTGEVKQIPDTNGTSYMDWSPAFK